MDKDKMIETLTLYKMMTCFPDGFDNDIEMIKTYLACKEEVKDAIAEFEGKNGEIG